MEFLDPPNSPSSPPLIPNDPLNLGNYIIHIFFLKKRISPRERRSYCINFNVSRIAKVPNKIDMKKRVVVDVDAGTDDAVALLLLLALENEKDYEVVGITCTHGNTTVENVCRNVLTTLQCVKRLDIPIFKGAEGPLIPLDDSNVVFEFFHGKNGFGDKNFLTKSDNIQPENAVAALNRLAIDNEGIVLICLGPLTNIALALRTYPEFLNNLKEVHIMGGNVNGVGNFSAAAEFNFFKDPEAAYIVLSSLTCPVTILPWETCLKDCLTKEERFEDIGSISQPQVKLLNEIETEIYKKEKFWTPSDAILVATFLDNSMIKNYRNLNMSVELHGLYTRGQGVVNPKKQANVRVVEEINVGVFKKLVYKMATFVPRNK